jgi:cobyrinic acid ac-diamide synthase
MDSYFIVENQDAQSQIDSIVNILYLFEDYDYVIFDTEGTVNNLTKAVLKATDYIFAPSKSSAIDINGLADLLNMYDISRVINPKLEIRKIFLVQTKQNTIVYKETKDELMKYFSNNEFSEISVREDQNILNSMKQQKDIFSYRSYSNAAIDYKNLVDEFLEEEEENEY